ncbi:MAG: DUF4365 domain-containing protein [Beduini sp.]|uniref:DUF4365 domain-containing protein n=1 Tax=Beduini sp. TaxID=1922300 RepID=UPI0011C9868A
MKFPKINNNKLKGITGESYFEYFVNNKLKCIYHKSSNDNDFGIDGFIELVINGYVTGKKVAVQIKHGDYYFRNMTIDGYKYIGENKHLNYYMNSQLPVFIVLIDDSLKNAIWIKFDINRIMRQNNNKWWIEIPRENQLHNNFFNALISSIDPIIDYEDEIEKAWMNDAILDNTDFMVIGIPKSDIYSMKLDSIRLVIDKLSKSKEKLIKARNTLELCFPEYDNDKREIYEIPEIMNWLVHTMDCNIPWFYFLNYKIDSIGLKLLMHSQCIKVNRYKQTDKHLILYDKYSVGNFFVKNFDILNKFIEKNNIDEEINREISDGIINYFESEI